MGHWHKDKTCPKHSEAFPKSTYPARPQKPKKFMKKVYVCQHACCKSEDFQKNNVLSRIHPDGVVDYGDSGDSEGNEVLSEVSPDEVLPFLAHLDTACAKSVVGNAALND